MTDAEAVAAIQRAARALAPAELHAAAVADGCRLQPKPFAPSVPLSDVYPDGAALLGAVVAGEPSAIGAAMRALARLDGEAILPAALVLSRQRTGALGYGAASALAHSRDDRALAVAMRALDDDGLLVALEKSVHPDATPRVRAALLATGIAMFEVRPRPSRHEWITLPADERERLVAMQPKGAPSPELKRAQMAIRVLAARGDLESTELVIHLLDSHPDDRLRLACVHALASMSDPRAHAALDRRWYDADSTVASIAIRAALRRDLATAWGRFARHIEPVLGHCGSPEDEQIVKSLLYAVHGGATPRHVDPDPLAVEPRFAELAAQLRRHPEIGTWARHVLEVMPRAAAVAAIDRHPYVAPKPAPVPRPARAPGDFLARYQRGEFGAWDELATHVAAIGQHADLRAEAYAVACELMTRVRLNIDTVRATLRAAGASVTDDDPPPTEHELARLVRLAGGPIPISLEAFWRTVGSAMLSPGGADRYDYGECELEAGGLSLIAFDPLELRGDVSYNLDSREEELADHHPELLGPLVIALSPDFLHKQNISGGSPHSIELPAETAADALDPWLLYTRYRTRLVDYLRVAFRYGGFPGLDVAQLPVDRIALNDRIGFENVRGSWAEAANRLLARLRRDLVRF